MAVRSPMKSTRFSIQTLLRWTLYCALVIPAIWKIVVDFSLTSVLIAFAVATVLLPFTLIPILIDYLLGKGSTNAEHDD